MVKFSVVTIVYNGGSEIQKTIESVIEQTYHNIEYIIIDGLSTDSTMNIINKFQSQIAKVISEKDNGLYDAMNKGINLAHGTYIIFMNCGDTFASENTLSLISHHIEKDRNKQNPDFIYGDSIEVDETGTNSYLKRARSYKFRWYGMFAHHQSMIYKTEIIKSLNLFYNQEFVIAADYQFTLEFLKHCSFIEKLNHPICIFKLGGLSSNWKNGIKEQWVIRRNILKYSKFKCFVISLILILLIYIRKYFNPFYNFMRFSTASKKPQ